MKNLKIHCCVCMQKIEGLQSLDCAAFDNVKYNEKLIFCAPKETWHEKYQICPPCITQLDSAYEFITICQRSESFRTESLIDVGYNNKESNEEEKPAIFQLFYCDHCQRSFGHKKFLSQHITKIHHKKSIKRIEKENSLKRRLFQCDQCNKSFGLKKFLSQHVTKIHIKNKQSDGEEKPQNPNLFYCDQCNRSFRLKKFLGIHVTKIHRKNERKDELEKRRKQNSFHCDQCKKSFGLKRALALHVTKMHSKFTRKKKKIAKKSSIKEEDKEVVLKSEKLHESDYDIKPEDTENINENESIHNVNFNISDRDDDSDDSMDDMENDVDYYFNNFESENGEEVTKQKPSRRLKPPIQCNFCEESFKKRQLWKAHIRSEHTFEKPFPCDECDAKYMNAYSLLIHKRKHTNEKPFICAQCGKSFVSSADLNHHNKIHDMSRPYPCPMCDRSFKTHSNLRTHRLQMHLDPAEWKFICNLCPKKFPIRGNLVKHLKRHAGIKEFSCHICSKQFINKAEMTLHLNTHTNERLFKCKLCSKEYKNREGLRRHMKVVHNLGNWKAPKSDRKYLCPMCPKIFAFSNKLQRHIFTHTGEKPYQCDYCPKRFIDSYGRKVHLKKEHEVEDESSLVKKEFFS